MYIIVGSATTAQRLKKAVEKTVGFPAYVVHTPAALKQRGCSYSVRFDDRALEAIKKTARDNGIAVKGIYMEENRNEERVYHAVS